MEVSQVLSSLPGVEEANVYGVQAGIPGIPGMMAAQQTCKNRGC